MKNSYCLLSVALLIAPLAAPAQTPASPTPQTQLATDSQKAKTRYEADLKLCADEPSSTTRLQCRRDAKAEYDKALAAAKEQATTTTQKQQARATCTDCGKVTAVHVVEREGEGGPVGMIAGGVAGALIGQQLGSGLGKDVATVAGAVGGAYAGKEIEKKVRTHKVWVVDVQYPNGSKGSFEFKEDPGYAVGDAVKKSGNSIVRD